MKERQLTSEGWMWGDGSFLVKGRFVITRHLSPDCKAGGIAPTKFGLHLNGTFVGEYDTAFLAADAADSIAMS